MPFCNSRTYNENLQISHPEKEFFTDRPAVRRASLGAFLKGSMTLEASLVLPFLLCAITALLYIFAFTSEQSKESRKLMERAEALAVTAGQMSEKDPYIRLYDAQIISLPFSHLSFGKNITVRSAVVRCWVGYTGESFQNSAGEEIVYITPEGTVYHKNRDCTYLRLSIRQISLGSLEGERNLSGGKYASCEYCIRRGEAGGTVYITVYGNSYHNNVNCQGLKRTILALPWSQAEGRPCCSRCSRSG